MSKVKMLLRAVGKYTVGYVACHWKEFLTGLLGGIAAGTVDASLLELGAAEEIAAAGDDGDLHARFDGRNNLRRDAAHYPCVDADTTSTEGLPRKLEQHPTWFGLCRFFCHTVPFVADRTHNAVF